MMADGARIGLRRGSDEQGVALIATMLIMMLMMALMLGLTAVVASDQRSRSTDRDRYKAFYAAHSGLEKLNADLAALFFANVAPTTAEIGALGDDPPSIPDITFTTAGAGAYGVTMTGASSGPISTGPYQGLNALKRTYELNSSVRTAGLGEAHLRRAVEAVAIPVFQFGIFSDPDLSFHAGPNFNFGGRVHTNGNLFLAEGTNNTLTLSERVTAVGEVVRKELANGNPVNVTGHEGIIKLATAPGAYRNLGLNEGSVVDGLGSHANGAWPTISLSTYNAYIRTGRTGARPLNLPLITSGGSNVNLIQRPPANEATANPTLFAERLFGKVSIRVLLSDRAEDITSLPTVTPTAPVALDGDWRTAPPNNGVAYGPVDAAHPPIARAPGNVAVTINGNVSAGSVSGGTGRTINTNAAIPNYWKLPATLAVTRAGVTWTIRCTGRTATTFTGCTAAAGSALPVAAVAAGAVVTADAADPADGNVPVQTVTTATWSSPYATLTVDATTSAAFTPRTFWVHNQTGTTVLVTCQGYTPAPAFTGCDVPVTLQNNATITTASRSAAGTGVIGGFLKVELQDAAGAWRDVTMEILNWGIGAANQNGRLCTDPTPNAILRLQRLRDNSATTGQCWYAGSPRSTDWWPTTLFDAREALQRDNAPAATAALKLGGVMHLVVLDVANLSRWLSGTGVYAGGSGTSALNVNGYAVYFSDRRNNRNALGDETGEYGFEDIVNPLTGGAPDGTLQAGEDVNGNGTLQTYGQFPSYNGVYNTAPPGAIAPLDAATARPRADLRVSEAQVNRAVLFRRGLKLINGGLGNIVAPGLTIASENPVYVQGDWNAAQTGYGAGVATSIIADSVTVLSNAWLDRNSFDNAWSSTQRPRSAQSYYRFAVIAGKNLAFPHPDDAATEDFGTDGGVHNFLRMLESGGTVNYRGSIVTFYYSRQANGTYKAAVPVYGAPTRNFEFDTNFLDVALLPPLTPVFRDLNSLGFTQEIRPGR